MQPDQILMVQDSWARISPLGTNATHRFYEQLFAVYPGFRELFPDDMEQQEKLLYSIINMAVTGLSQFAIIKPVVKRIGQRHRGMGLGKEEFRQFGQILLETLEHSLGDHWTPELAVAWEMTYQLLSDTMIGEVAESGQS